jgi:hypothetical protein
MACLSKISEDGHFVVYANPIFIQRPYELQDGATLIFEVIEIEATALKKVVGAIDSFVVDSQAFVGILEELLPVQSATGEMFGRSMLRGKIFIKNLLLEEQTNTLN